MDGRREISPSAFSKPSPWGPTPLVKGRWPKARGDRVRWPRRGRMRGQVSDCICCTQGSFAACGRRVSFPAMGKKPKDCRGTAQDGHSVSIFAFPIPSGLRPSPLDKGSRPLVPRYGRRSSESLYIVSGAQNLSDTLNSCRATGPWVYKNCRGCGSKTAPGFSQPTLPVRFPP